MKRFDEAARKAAEEIADDDCGYDGYVPNEIMQATIALHFAPLAATHERMVALLNLITEQIGEDGGTGPDVENVLSDAYAILRDIGEIEGEA